ncbi:MAG TPA: cytochrome b/b6 domain-containing protein [Thermoanaerobaculia bacterium]|nr:cytochrome b/b6 domain-containing protein [Thermoanaerobaculia bacterium]
MKKLVRKHPLAIRWFHWINFPLLALMIWSGTLIYWAYPAYVKLPQGTWKALHVNNRLAEGMALHFFFMWLFAINGIAYVTYLAVSGEWRPRKYPRLQYIAYVTIVLMGLGSLLTGLAIYKPVQLSWLTAMFGGYQIARGLHFLLTAGYIGFFLIHVIQVMRAGWNNFRAMVIGYEVRRD